MAGKIQSELRQSKAIKHPSEEAALNILRTSDVLTRVITELLKPSGLSPTQYNVLRILRGAGTEGICCKEIGDRLITRDPDVTRLIDRLEKRSLLVRVRGKEDRRYVTIHLSPEGLNLVNRLDEPVNDLSRKLMRNIHTGDIKVLIDLLERVREGL